MDEENKEIMLKVRNVTMRFNKFEMRVDSLKELVIRAFKSNLKKKKFECLKDVSFDIHKGEAVAIIGKNGAGKSTLLKIVSGILKPTKGYTKRNGRITPLLRLGAGFDHNATGLENIFLNAAILGYTKKQINDKLQDIIDFSELGDFIYSPLKTYSQGMVARLGFSIAINMDSEILLIDEILAVGDIAFNKKCHEKLAELRSKGLTFLIVSHGEGVKRYCTRAIWIDDGVVREDGDISTVFKHYTETMIKPKPAPEPAPAVAAAPAAPVKTQSVISFVKENNIASPEQKNTAEKK